MSAIPTVLTCRLIKTTRRLTFDIVYQDPKTIWMGDDDGDYYRFVASNGYEVISRSRMDIQTERLWREQDATKNSVSMLAQHHFSHKELQEMHDLKMALPTFGEMRDAARERIKAKIAARKGKPLQG